MEGGAVSLPRVSHVWSPETIEDIQRKAQLGRYVMGAYLDDAPDCRASTT